MGGWTDGRMDGWTDGRMDGRLRRVDSFNGERFAELARAAKPRLGEFNAQDKNKRTWLGQNC